MTLPKFDEENVAFLMPDIADRLQVKQEPRAPVLARPMQNPDWDTLLTEVQTEFRKTLDGLAK